MTAPISARLARDPELCWRDVAPDEGPDAGDCSQAHLRHQKRGCSTLSRWLEQRDRAALGGRKRGPLLITPGLHFKTRPTRNDPLDTSATPGRPPWESQRS